MSGGVSTYTADSPMPDAQRANSSTPKLGAKPLQRVCDGADARVPMMPVAGRGRWAREHERRSGWAMLRGHRSNGEGAITTTRGNLPQHDGEQPHAATRQQDVEAVKARRQVAHRHRRQRKAADVNTCNRAQGRTR
jgi:hypothetical protein